MHVNIFSLTCRYQKIPKVFRLPVSTSPTCISVSGPDTFLVLGFLSAPRPAVRPAFANILTKDSLGWRDFCIFWSSPAFLLCLQVWPRWQTKLLRYFASSFGPGFCHSLDKERAEKDFCTTFSKTFAGHSQRLQQRQPPHRKCFWPRRHRLHQCCPSPRSGADPHMSAHGCKVAASLPNSWIQHVVVAKVNADTSTLNTHVWFVMQVKDVTFASI